jgi:hypothetical protein
VTARVAAQTSVRQDIVQVAFSGLMSEELCKCGHARDSGLEFHCNLRLQVDHAGPRYD